MTTLPTWSAQEPAAALNGPHRHAQGLLSAPAAVARPAPPIHPATVDTDTHDELRREIRRGASW